MKERGELNGDEDEIAYEQWQHYDVKLEQRTEAWFTSDEREEE